jgi:DNA polymerase IV
MVICGGYRRGKSDSGDVDVVLSHPDEEVTDGFLPQLTANLEDDGWITHMLEISMMNSKRGQHPLRWKGLAPKAKSGFDTLDHAFVVWQNPSWVTEVQDLERNPTAKNPNLHRRVDIIISPWKTAGCAVLGWTGGTMFERDLRNYSRHELGWKFDSSGVRSVLDGTWIDVEQGGEDLLAKERMVFERLKLQWREPYERCTD